MKFFIASSVSNHKQAQYLSDNLISLGHETVSYAPHSHNKSLFAVAPDWRERKELKKIFESDVTGLEEADRFVLLLPADMTAYMSAGIAYGFGKHLTLIGAPETIESHYFIFDEDYPNTEAYIKALRTT